MDAETASPVGRTKSHQEAVNSLEQLYQDTLCKGLKALPPPEPPVAKERKLYVDLPQDIYGVAIAVCVGDLPLILGFDNATKARTDA